MSDQPKRPYKRLTPSVWAEIRALWETGEVTLAELADRYGVRTRTLQAHFDKHGTIKAAKAKEIASVVQAQIYSAMNFDVETRVQLGKEAQTSAYQNAVAIERLVMAQLEEAQKTPENAFRAATAIKTLSLAAQALERVNGIKRSALGLDELVSQEDLPILEIVELTQEEIERMHQSQEEDDWAVGCDPAHEAISEEDEVVIEEGRPEECEAGRAGQIMAKEAAEQMETFGGRLVRSNFVQ